MTTPTLTLREGRYYMTRDGRKVGPLKQTGAAGLAFYARLLGRDESWYPNGKWWSEQQVSHLCIDLVQECTKDGTPITDAPTPQVSDPGERELLREIRDLLRDRLPAPAAKAAEFRNDGNEEARFIADGERLNCPTCGGSGHADDAKPTAGPRANTSAWKQACAEIFATPLSEIKGGLYKAIESRADELEAAAKAEGVVIAGFRVSLAPLPPPVIATVRNAAGETLWITDEGVTP